LVEEIVKKKSTLVWDLHNLEIFSSGEKLTVKSMRILPEESVKA